MTGLAPFSVGITSDFETRGKGLLDAALSVVFDPAGIEYEVMPDTGGVGLSEVIDRYDAIIVLDWRFPAESFHQLRRLVVLARWGVGYDQVDTRACSDASVILAITPDSVRGPVAEGILALIFSLAKNLPTLDRNCRAGLWRSDAPVSVDLRGSSLGSVGMGNIACEMFRIARALGFGRLLACSRSLSPQAGTLGVEVTDLDTVMRESDFVATNCPLNAETRGMLGARELALMKPSSYLINTARGAIVDEIALLQVLRERRIAGAGLDVFAIEPIRDDHPFFELDNVVLTPHLIARTRGCIRDTSLSACRNVLAVAQGRVPPYVVNRDVLAHPRIRSRLTNGC
jgi:phosphoglycerate dehydrogenase-like enzyme